MSNKIGASKTITNHEYNHKLKYILGVYNYNAIYDINQFCLS